MPAGRVATGADLPTLAESLAAIGGSRGTVRVGGGARLLSWNLAVRQRLVSVAHALHASARGHADGAGAPGGLRSFTAVSGLYAMVLAAAASVPRDTKLVAGLRS